MKIILALLGIFIVVTLVRAIFFKEKKQEKEKLLPEMINMEKYCRDLSDAIKAMDPEPLQGLRTC